MMRRNSSILRASDGKISAIFSGRSQLGIKKTSQEKKSTRPSVAKHCCTIDPENRSGHQKIGCTRRDRCIQRASVRMQRPQVFPLPMRHFLAVPDPAPLKYLKNSELESITSISLRLLKLARYASRLR